MKPSPFFSLVVCSVLLGSSSHAQTADAVSSRNDSLLHVGITAYIDGRYADATTALKVLSDSSAQAAYYLGSAYVALGDNQPAARILKHAVALSPSQATYHVQFARVLAQIGKPDEAENEYRQVLTLDSLNLSALTNLGALLIDRHAYRDGTSLLEKAAAINPRNALLYYQLASAMVHTGMPDSARAFLSTSLTLNSGYVPALILMGSLYFEKKEFSDALRMYSAAAERNRFAADLWYKAGLCQEKLEDFAAARKSFLKAVELDTSFESAFAHLGQACYNLGMTDSAITAYECAVAIDDQNPLYHVNLGIAWARKDTVERAARSYQNAIRALKPEAIGGVYERLGNLRFSKMQYRQARNAYLKGVQFAPFSGTIPYNLALTYDHLKQYKSAVTWYKKFLRTASGDPDMAKRVEEAKGRLNLLEPKVASAQK